MENVKLPNGRVFVPKKWGYEDWIVNNDKYCGKVLFFKQGLFCSFHFHKLKEETFFIQSGLLKVQYTYCDNIHVAKEIVLQPGEHFHVPIGLRHRMTGLLDTVMFEFSTHHEDSDSYRIEV
jgi:mannose-6-phosphate isomerase-like protein (cupin superfamily)